MGHPSAVQVCLIFSTSVFDYVKLNQNDLLHIARFKGYFFLILFFLLNYRLLTAAMSQDVCTGVLCFHANQHDHTMECLPEPPAHLTVVCRLSLLLTIMREAGRLSSRHVEE